MARYRPVQPGTGSDAPGMMFIKIDVIYIICDLNDVIHQFYQNQTLFPVKICRYYILYFFVKCDVVAADASEKIMAMFLVLTDYWTDNDTTPGI